MKNPHESIIKARGIYHQFSLGKLVIFFVILQFDREKQCFCLFFVENTGQVHEKLSRISQILKK